MRATNTDGSAVVTTLIVLGVVMVLAAAFVATALVTDRPAFCQTCHEMKPYYVAWQKGPHQAVWCIDCHVDAGYPARFEHKFVALKEVWAHVTGDTSFPRPEPADVPDRRCLRCHPEPGPKKPPVGFSHAAHQKLGPCQSCHADTGHDVTVKDLEQAGILNAQNAAERAAVAIAEGRVAAPGAGKANLPGHVAVPCSRCHDMKATTCEACHKAPTSKEHPKDAAKCATCHKPGSEWKFDHAGATDCRSCHTPPANHFGDDCARCHRPGTSFSDATFRHPGIPGGEHTYRSFPCSKCHPQGPPKPSCTCHGGGIFQDD